MLTQKAEMSANALIGDHDFYYQDCHTLTIPIISHIQYQPSSQLFKILWGLLGVGGNGGK